MVKTESVEIGPRFTINRLSFKSDIDIQHLNKVRLSDLLKIDSLDPKSIRFNQTHHQTISIEIAINQTNNRLTIDQHIDIKFISRGFD